jgi:hypothetical protein
MESLVIWKTDLGASVQLPSRNLHHYTGPTGACWKQRFWYRNTHSRKSEYQNGREADSTRIAHDLVPEWIWSR